MLGENGVKLIQEVRKLREYSLEMKMATRYKDFNFGYLDRLLVLVVDEIATDEEKKILRPVNKIIIEREDI